MRRTFIPLSHTYYDYRIDIEPVRSGVWRYRVWQQHPVLGVMRDSALVCDTTTATKANAFMRARALVRSRKARQPRWPRH